jgi:hypothetical protein
MRITVTILMVMMFSSNVFAERVRTRGDRTDVDVSSEKNDAGVTTRKSSRGGEAKTKNGKGVYKSPVVKPVSGRKITKAAIEV